MTHGFTCMYAHTLIILMQETPDTSAAVAV